MSTNKYLASYDNCNGQVLGQQQTTYGWMVCRVNGPNRATQSFIVEYLEDGNFWELFD